MSADPKSRHDGSGPTDGVDGSCRLSEEQIRAYDEWRLPAARGTLCHAPFETLRFNPGGKVLPCSQNSIHELGRYPQSSVREIWDGARTAALRERFRRYTFASGCHECQRDVVAGRLDSVRAKIYDGLAGVRRSPALLDFKLDTACNLACVMCWSYTPYRRRTDEGDTPPHAVYDEAFVEELGEFIPELEEARFTGGEPFLSDTYHQIWRRIAELNPDCRLWIQTNGAVLNDPIRTLLDRLRVGFNFSLDSLDEHRFEAIRVGAKYSTVRRNLEFFRSYCVRKSTELTINTCAMRRNWMEIPSIVEFCNSIGVRIAFCFVWFPTEAALWTMTAEAIAEVHQCFRAVDLPGRDPIEDKNRGRFQELTAMIGSCYEAALARQRPTEGASPLVTEAEVRAALAGGCRSLASNSTEGHELAMRLDRRLERIASDVEQKQRLVAYLSLFLGMFSADIIVDTLLREPVDEVRRDVEALRFAPSAS